jgi:hypothetical protein
MAFFVLRTLDVIKLARLRNIARVLDNGSVNHMFRISNGVFFMGRFNFFYVVAKPLALCLNYALADELATTYSGADMLN